MTIEEFKAKVAARTKESLDALYSELDKRDGIELAIFISGVALDSSLEVIFETFGIHPVYDAPPVECSEFVCLPERHPDHYVGGRHRRKP